MVVFDYCWYVLMLVELSHLDCYEISFAEFALFEPAESHLPQLHHEDSTTVWQSRSRINLTIIGTQLPSNLNVLQSFATHLN